MTFPDTGYRCSVSFLRNLLHIMNSKCAPIETERGNFKRDFYRETQRKRRDREKDTGKREERK
jgi:hypothetical protein